MAGIVVADANGTLYLADGTLFAEYLHAPADGRAAHAPHVLRPGEASEAVDMFLYGYGSRPRRNRQIATYQPAKRKGPRT